MEFEENYRDTALEKEAHLFAHYLLDRDPQRDMVDRYISANRQLGVNTVTAENEHILNFSVSHPWSIPFLDASAGILQSDSLIRKKIYTMAAILEASPEYTDHFFPKSLSPIKLFVNLIANGLTAGIKIMIGIPIFFYVRGKNDD